MSKIVLDKQMRAKLNNLQEQFELCDESGHTLGQFLPTEVYERLVYDWAKSQFTDEELDLARQQPGDARRRSFWNA